MTMLNKNTIILLLLFPFIASAQQMWINEIHYDNTGGDVDEFVEIVVENTFAGNISDLELVFYNGSNGTVIGQSEPRTLDTFTEHTVVSGFRIFSRIFSSIQNGAPDGMALINNGVVVEFISYEGTLTATDGPAIGMTSSDIGVFEPGAIGESLQLSGNGNQSQLFTWQTPAAETMGSINNGQSFEDAAPLVKTTFPLDGTTGVDLSTVVTVEFSEDVTTNASSFDVVCSGVIQTIVVNQLANQSNYSITPDSTWTASSTCEVTMIAANIIDVEGNNNPLDGDGDGTGGDNFTFSFDVVSDSLPKVLSTVPVNNAVLLPVDFTFDINFTEAVNLTANAVNLNCPGTITYTTTSLTNVMSVTIDPDTNVAMGSLCTVTIVGNEIVDIDGDNSLLDGDEDGIAGGNYVFMFSVIEEIVEIHEIQGSGSASSLDGNFVRTEGDVVTALTSNGFYMQAPDADNDADSETSEGILVFTNNNFTVAVGDLVDVRGRVVEFFELTEIESVSSVSITASNQTLPTVVEFNATNPSQLSPANRDDFDNRFEKYEGMLVSVANGISNSGTSNFGEFFATATGQRAIREPGVEFSETGDSQIPYDLLDPPNPLPTNYEPEIFDENPELFNVDTNGLLGMPIIDINGGSTFSATGVLSYSFGSYNLLPKVINTVNKPFVAIDTPTATEITVATQNMFRFFDDVDDPEIDDFQEDSTTTERFVERTEKASLYFRTIMLAPDIIVLTEIENLVAVQAIADQITADDGTLAYTAHLIEGQDFGGIDIGFLAKSTVTGISISQLGRDETIAFNPPPPPELPRPLHDRPPLLLNAIVTKGGLSKEINVLGVHNRSRSGITGGSTANRNRIRHKHLEQALSIANMVQNLQSSTAALVVIGDYNDFEFSDGYADVIGEIKGVVDINKNLLSSNGSSVVNPTLINAVDTLANEEKYSFIFRGTIQALDHALINDVALFYLTKTTFVRGNIDAPEKFEDDYTQTLKMSDHDGLMLYLDLNFESIFLNGFE
jgi:hypothetical protein